VLQLLIRLGEKDPTLAELKDLGVLTAGEEELEEVPDCYNKAKLTPITIDQVCFWDETHKKVRFGGAESIGACKRRCIRFYRDEKGMVVDEDKGELKPQASELMVKYPGEARFCLGVTKKGQEGKRCEPWIYSECRLLSVVDYEKKVNEEVQRVKKEGRASEWVVGGRAEGDIYAGDCPSVLKGCSKAKAKVLAGLHVETVAQMASTDVQPFKGTSASMIGKWKEQAASAKPGNAPVGDDLRTAYNPYLSRFGAGKWRKEVSERTALKKFKCVTEMVDHIVAESRKMVDNGDNFLFYHDALSIMTARECRNYMQAKGVLKHWVLPEFGLNDDFPRFKGVPLGNSPELMPLDASLNKDVDDGVARHCGITGFLKDNDPRKFLRDTPKRLNHAYVRVWEGWPESKRIVEDIDKFTLALHKIFEAKGVMIPDGRNIQKGDRKVDGKDERGGKTVKLPDQQMKWLHADAVSAKEEKKTGLKRKWDEANET
jgi:hypothetical protein